MRCAKCCPASTKRSTYSAPTIATKRSRSSRVIRPAPPGRHETPPPPARHPDCALVLLDLALPGAHGLDLLAELRRTLPRLPILVFSATHDRAPIGAAPPAG